MTTALKTHAETVDPALTWSTATSASAESRSLDVIASQRWTLVRPTAVEMGPDARPVKTIKTSIARAQSVGLVACAMKTLTNVTSRHHHAATVPPVRTSTDRTSAFALKDMKERTAQSTPMIALPSLVRTVEHVWTKSATTLACATKDSKGSNARSISTNVFHNRVKMAPRATSMSIPTLALVHSAFRG